LRFFFVAFFLVFFLRAAMVGLLSRKPGTNRTARLQYKIRAERAFPRFHAVPGTESAASVLARVLDFSN
jgi:hypothetical protein